MIPDEPRAVEDVPVVAQLFRSRMPFLSPLRMMVTGLVFSVVMAALVGVAGAGYLEGRTTANPVLALLGFALMILVPVSMAWSGAVWMARRAKVAKVEESADE